MTRASISRTNALTNSDKVFSKKVARYSREITFFLFAAAAANRGKRFRALSRKARKTPEKDLTAALFQARPVKLLRM